MRLFALVGLLLIISLSAPAESATMGAMDEGAGGNLAVLSTSPAARSLANPRNATITVDFDRAINPTTVTPQTVMAFGKWSGPVLGTLALSNGDQRITLTPNEGFFAGEVVMVMLSEGLLAQDGSRLPDGGFHFDFWVASASGSLDFTVIDTLSVRSNPSVQVQSYGGFATDLNDDGWADLSIVNELSADIRTFLNRADGTGLFEDYLTPPAAVAFRASPSEPADFNGDGAVDVVVANIGDASVSILLGNGDGTFGPQQKITVGQSPRGIAVLDVDGDGDADVVNSNYDSNNLSILLNNGNGVFGPPTFFEGGGNGEWALGAADMDEDGRADLVVGTRDSQTMITLHNEGDGTFTVMHVQPAGRAWMLMLGDLNGDRHVDVSVVNSDQNNGGILFGDGAGALSPPTTYPTDPFALATDLGDIDGDGDLDWITSSFSGDWRLFLNDGNGLFNLFQEFPATAAASCALMVDIDNDRDLDLALIDELDDTVQLARQNGGELVERIYLPLVAK